MTTQTLECPIGIAGLTLTANLYADGADAVALATGISLTAGANDGTNYFGTTTISGAVKVVILNGSTVFARGWAILPASGQGTLRDNRDANVGWVNLTAQTARDIGASVLLSAGTGTGQLDFTSGVVKANATQFAGQTITAAAGVTIPSSLASPTNITAASGVSLAASQHVIVDSGTVTTVTNQLTGAQIATAVWTDTTASDFTTALSVGKSIINGVTLGTGLTINGYTGNTPQSGDAYTRIGASGAGLTALGDTRLANLDAAVSSRLATSSYTAPDNANIGVAATQATTANAALGAAGAGLTAIPKTGYKLASDGLDAVATTAPSGVASNFREMVVSVWRRLYKKSTLTSTQLKTYADNDVTVLTTQAVSDDGTTQTQGDAT